MAHVQNAPPSSGDRKPGIQSAFSCRSRFTIFCKIGIKFQFYKKKILPTSSGEKIVPGSLFSNHVGRFLLHPDDDEGANSVTPPSFPAPAPKSPTSSSHSLSVFLASLVISLACTLFSGNPTSPRPSMCSPGGMNFFFPAMTKEPLPWMVRRRGRSWWW